MMNSENIFPDTTPSNTKKEWVSPELIVVGADVTESGASVDTQETPMLYHT